MKGSRFHPSSPPGSPRVSSTDPRSLAAHKWRCFPSVSPRHEGVSPCQCSHCPGSPALPAPGSTLRCQARTWRPISSATWPVSSAVTFAFTPAGNSTADRVTSGSNAPARPTEALANRHRRGHRPDAERLGKKPVVAEIHLRIEVALAQTRQPDIGAQHVTAGNPVAKRHLPIRRLRQSAVAIEDHAMSARPERDVNAALDFSTIKRRVAHLRSDFHDVADCSTSSENHRAKSTCACD